MLIDVVARYKEAVKIPCGTVTYMDLAHAPDFFEAALAEGKVDFYIMNRPLTVDFEYVNKLREGRIDEIAPCTRCLHCHIGSNEMNAMMGYCRVNALTQRVMREGGPAMYSQHDVRGRCVVRISSKGRGGRGEGREAGGYSRQRDEAVEASTKSRKGPCACARSSGAPRCATRAPRGVGSRKTTSSAWRTGRQIGRASCRERV